MVKIGDKYTNKKGRFDIVVTDTLYSGYLQCWVCHCLDGSKEVLFLKDEDIRHCFKEKK